LYIIDCFAVDPRPLFDSLPDAVLIGHNLAFDLGFLTALGFEPRDVRCTMLLSQLLHGTRRPKGFHTLRETAAREIGRTLDKEQQRSDWSGDLTHEQLDYAAADVAVLMPLYDALASKIETAGMSRVAEIENRGLPAMVWLEQAGVPFDRTAWQALAEQAAQQAEELGQQLDEAAPPREGYLSKTGAWNWDSTQQVHDVLQRLGYNLESTDDDMLATVPHPIADLVRRRRSAKKRTGTYGKKWLHHVADDGRVYASFHQIGTDTGRMSCSDPNLQQIPNDTAYRRCFRASEGRVLVKADYSQIELRIACRIAAERNMRKAYATGADLHRITAQKMTGREEVTKEERAMAKPVNFGMIYGLSPDGLRRKAKSEYGIDLSAEDAARFRNAFFAAWPDITRWHNDLRSANPSEVTTRAGRLLRLPEKRHFGMIANYSVQGTGGDGVKAALGLLWERRGECLGARPVLVVHDEIVLECLQEHAETAADWLKRAMVDGMSPLIKPVPVEVEVKIAQTWGG
jgi:DNA polymerase-1